MLNMDNIKFSKLVENLQQGIGIIDEQYAIIYCNLAFAHMFDMSKNDMLGKKLYKIIDTNKREIFKQYFSLDKKIKKPAFDIQIVTKDGQHKVILINIYPNIVNETDDYIGWVITADDITEQKKAEKNMRYFVFHDSLTGLYNRAYFDEQMARMNKDLKRFSPLSIISIDLDGLKIINDTCGHEAGDVALKKAADIISSVFRKTDVVARIGGDEFCIILPDTSYEVAASKKAVLLSMIDEYNAKCENNSIPISISIGVAAIQNINDETIYDIYQLADSDMYKDKMGNLSICEDRIVPMIEYILKKKQIMDESRLNRLITLVNMMGDELDLPEEIIDNLIMLSKIHDVGKAAIPVEEFIDISPLVEEKYEVLKNHSQIGYNIILRNSQLTNMARLVLHHHENWDGTGYPSGLKGYDIPIECRILSIIEEYDTLMNPFGSELPLTKEKALENIKKEAGTKFDPILVQRFVDVMETKGY